MTAVNLKQTPAIAELLRVSSTNDRLPEVWSDINFMHAVSHSMRSWSMTPAADGLLISGERRSLWRWTAGWARQLCRGLSSSYCVPL